MDYLVVKTVHIVSAALLVGTGFGTAFFLYFANRSRWVVASIAPYALAGACWLLVVACTWQGWRKRHSAAALPCPGNIGSSPAAGNCSATRRSSPCWRPTT